MGKHPTNLFWREWLRQANIAWKNTPGVFQAEVINACKGTPLLPRDIFISGMRGRLWVIQTTDGRTLYPMVAKSDISKSLNIIGQTPGDLLFRDTTLWERLGIGTNGQFLKSDGTRPVWGTGAAPAGARVKRTSNFIVSGATLTPIPWQAIAFDDKAFWSVTFPNRLTIPAGITRVILSAGWAGTHVFDSTHYIYIRDKNGTIIAGHGARMSTNPYRAVDSGLLQVAPGDWFDVAIFTSFAFSINILNATFFSITTA